MDILKGTYFAVLGIYIFQCLLARKIRLNWILILTAVAIHAIYFFGWQGLEFLSAIAIISTTAELVSLKTRFRVFGVAYRYDLSNKFFPSKIVLGGAYPLEVTAFWILLKYLSFFLAIVMLSPLGIHEITKVLTAALILVSFDFLLDPFAVSRGAWKWEKPGMFFGIPWQNFLGWFLVGSVISLVFINLDLQKPVDSIMIVPVFVVFAMFPLVIGSKLMSIDKIKGVIASTPLTILLLLGLVSLLYHF